jgi:kynurenine formamidase
MRWINLSHPFYNGMPNPKSFTEPQFKKLFTLEKNNINVTEYQLTVHVGTHVDAPSHFIPNGLNIDELPLEWFMGEGIVIPVKKEPLSQITVEDLLPFENMMKENDIVVIHTGWHSLFGEEAYNDHPYLSVECAEWLLSKKIKGLGVDFTTPDCPIKLRQQGFNWPVHHLLLKNNILIIENLNNLTELDNRRIFINASPIIIKGADGAPARVIAKIMD